MLYWTSYRAGSAGNFLFTLLNLPHQLVKERIDLAKHWVLGPPEWIHTPEECVNVNILLNKIKYGLQDNQTQELLDKIIELFDAKEKDVIVSQGGDIPKIFYTSQNYVKSILIESYNIHPYVRALGIAKKDGIAIETWLTRKSNKAKITIDDIKEYYITNMEPEKNGVNIEKYLNFLETLYAISHIKEYIESHLHRAVKKNKWNIEPLNVSLDAVCDWQKAIDVPTSYPKKDNLQIDYISIDYISLFLKLQQDNLIKLSNYVNMNIIENWHEQIIKYTTENINLIENNIIGSCKAVAEATQIAKKYLNENN
tara:strand:+ start:1245 stop:2177 length:933 start_codon:yes stop_codon:yes gene_type:complete